MTRSKQKFSLKLNDKTLILRYLGFALLATTANCFTQIMILRFTPNIIAVYVALIAGTGIGFVVKYLLDKKYIFYYASSSRKQELWVMLLYLSTSVVLTFTYLTAQLIIFYYYGEGIFFYISGTIVLLLGYLIKFLLDGRFVFKAADAAAQEAQSMKSVDHGDGAQASRAIRAIG